MRTRRPQLAMAVAMSTLLLCLGMPVQAAGPSPAPEGPFMAEGEVSESTVVAAAAPAEGFTDSIVISGRTNPTAVRFAADGRVVVAQKDGRLYVYPTLGSPSPVLAIDLRTNVHDYWDRGLLGLALDPAFTTNGRVYVAYTYNHILGSSDPAPRWPDGCPSPPGGTTDGCVVSGRISRFTLTNNVAGSEQVLVEDWCQQFPSHSVGALAFGSDGYLYASAGDGASFTTVDYGQRGGSLANTPTPANPCGDPPGGVGVANTSPSGRGGALRSQSLRRPAGEPVSLDGTIIRINPSTGAAAPTNPLAGSGDPIAARIVAFGLRNPFRFAFRPGTSELWLGDVGWESHEEINRLVAPASAPVENFGWPCYEGTGEQAGYADLTQCDELTQAAVVAPYYSYGHGQAVVSGDGCSTASGSSVSGVAFYQGGSYPSKYANALFFADYSRNCIWAMLATSGLPDPAKRELFVGAAVNPVDLQVGPGGDLFYVDISGGTIHRVIYAGENTPPVAVISATPTSGLAPLDVSFDGTGSSDPDPGDTISYAWDFTNDGTTDATTATATFRYSSAGTYTARLTVTDSRGGSASATQTISAGNSAPTPTISAPSSSLTWAVGDSISFSGSATDAQDGTLPASALHWTFTILHCTTPSNCHDHEIETRSGVASGTFAAPDHGYPSSIQITLRATDSGGLSTTVTRIIQPKIVDLAFSTSPTGVGIVINGSTSITTSSATTIHRTAIVNSQNSVTASSPQIYNAIEYAFSTWSDGVTSGSRTIVAPATAWPSPLGAGFQATSADLWLQQSGTLSSTGRSIAWKVVARNRLGGMKASPVKVKVDLSPKVGRPTFTLTTGWSCVYKGAKHRVVCTKTALAAGAKAKIKFTTSVVKRKNSATNTTTISSPTRDVHTVNNVLKTSVRLQ